MVDFHLIGSLPRMLSVFIMFSLLMVSSFYLLAGDVPITRASGTIEPSELGSNSLTDSVDGGVLSQEHTNLNLQKLDAASSQYNLDYDTLTRVQLPFIANEGQVANSDVNYYSRTFAGTVYVTDDSIVYAFAHGSSANLLEVHAVTDSGVAIVETFDGKISGIDVEGLKPGRAEVNSYIGAEQNWRSNIATFEGVTFGEVWDGITVDLNSYGKNVEKIFRIAPEADVSDILILVQGAEGLQIQSIDGTLLIETELGPITMTKPVAYQLIAGTRTSVEVDYRITGESRYGFLVGDYDHSLPLVIDPVLASTFIGDSSFEHSKAITIAPTGEVIIVGDTFSTSFPTTPGTFNQTHGAETDVFVSKFSEDLTNLEASTFIGGDFFEFPGSITNGPSDTFYITGTTGSSDFPTVASGGASPYQNVSSGLNEVFVARLNSTLGLLASTYVGGSSYDFGNDITTNFVGGSWYVYITGASTTTGGVTTFPVTDSSTGADFTDVFVSMLDDGLTTLVSSTVVGGDSYDSGHAIAADPADGSIYVTGLAGDGPTIEFPTTPSAYDNSSALDDAFVQKYNSSLSLEASTLLGGGDNENGYLCYDCADVAVGINNVYVSGITFSSDFPATAAAFDTTFNGSSPYNSDLFVAAFEKSGSTTLNSLDYATYLGGSDIDFLGGMAVDSNNEDVYVLGHTWSDDHPTTPGAYSETYIDDDDRDIFISRLDQNLSTLIASTYFGGDEDQDYDNGETTDPNSDDIAEDIALIYDGGSAIELYFTGETIALNYPITAGAFQVDHTIDEDFDVFVTHITANLTSSGSITDTEPPVGSILINGGADVTTTIFDNTAAIFCDDGNGTGCSDVSLLFIDGSANATEQEVKSVRVTTDSDAVGEEFFADETADNTGVYFLSFGLHGPAAGNVTYSTGDDIYLEFDFVPVGPFSPANKTIEAVLTDNSSNDSPVISDSILLSTDDTSNLLFPPSTDPTWGQLFTIAGNASIATPQPPNYLLRVNWGDGTHDDISPVPDLWNASHVYDRTAIGQRTITATLFNPLASISEIDFVTVDVQKKDPILTLTLPPGPVGATSLTAKGEETDPDTGEGIENVAISFAASDGGTIIPSTITKGVHALDSSPGLTIEPCAACGYEGSSGNSSILYVHEGATFTLPPGATGVSFDLQGADANHVLLTGLKSDGTTVTVDGTGDELDIVSLTLTASSPITQVTVSEVVDNGGGGAEGPRIGILGIRLFNSAGDPPELMFVNMNDQNLISVATTTLVSLEPGAYYSIGIASDPIGGAVLVDATSAETPYYNSAATSTLYVPRAGNGVGGTGFTFTPDSNSGFVSLLCSAADPDADYDGLCNSWETAGQGIPYNVGATQFKYALPDSTSNFAGGAVENGRTGIRDLYVHIDAMNGHNPDNGALADVITKFGAHNIRLHIVEDQLALTHVSNLNVWTDADANSANDFDSIKAVNLWEANRRATFAGSVSYTTSPTTGGSASTNVVTTVSGITMTTPSLPSGTGTATTAVAGTIIIKNLVTLSGSGAVIGSVDQVSCTCPSPPPNLTFGTGTASASPASGPGIPANSFIVTIKLPFTYILAGGGNPAAVVSNYNLGSISATVHPTTTRTGVSSSGGTTVAVTSFQEAMAQAWRYGLWAHDIGPTVCSSGVGGPSGISENGGNDFIVSLGCGWGGTDGSQAGGTVGTRNEQAGTFMHELGHTVNLEHGGPINEFAAVFGTHSYVRTDNSRSSGVAGANPLEFTVTGIQLKTFGAVTASSNTFIQIKSKVTFSAAPSTITIAAGYPQVAGVGSGIIIPSSGNSMSVTVANGATSAEKIFTIRIPFSTTGAVSDLTLGTFKVRFTPGASGVTMSVNPSAASGSPAINMATLVDSSYNCKPNYISVMSYTRQVDRTYLTGNNWQLDYSSGLFTLAGAPNPLNEAALNEDIGLRSSTATAPVIVYATPGRGAGWTIGSSTANGAAGDGTDIDWDGDGLTPDNAIVANRGDGSLYASNINNFGIQGCEGTGASYNDHDDWSHLQFNFRLGGANFDGSHPDPTKIPELTATILTQIKNQANGFSGILQPINADGSSIFKLGNSVPVKLKLFDGTGTPITNAHLVVRAALISHTVIGEQSESVSTSKADTGEFRYDLKSGNYIFNLGTGKGTSLTQKGSYALFIYKDYGTATQSLLRDQDFLFEFEGTPYTVMISLK